MVLRLKLIQTRKNNPSEWVIWERSEADTKQWLEHEVNLYDEIMALSRQSKGKKSTRRKVNQINSASLFTTLKLKFNKAQYKLQFEADHNEASKDAIIAIDDLKFFNTCKTDKPRSTRPAGKPSRTTAAPPVPKGNKHLNLLIFWLSSVICVYKPKQVFSPELERERELVQS